MPLVNALVLVYLVNRYKSYVTNN